MHSLANSELEKKIEIFLQEGKSFRLRITYLGQNASSILAFIISQLTQKYNILHLKKFFLSSLRESLHNSIKANLKRAFFLQNNLDIQNESAYKKGMNLFEKIVQEDKLSIFIPESKKRGFFAELAVEHSSDAIIFKIINNAPMTSEEEVRVRKKFHAAMENTNFLTYLENGLDLSEGAGLGIALTVSILRGLGLDPNTYRIYKNSKQTIVRLVFPLNPAYIDQREKYRRQHNLVSLFE